MFDGDGTSALPLGLAEPFGTFANDVDGFDSRPGVLDGSIYWTVDAATAGGVPAYSTPGFTANDVFIGPAASGYATAPVIYVAGAALGLVAGDEMDALAVKEDGTPGFTPGLDGIFFSLAPGSPSLVGAGASPGDVLFSAGGGAFGVFTAGTLLGLAPTDNLDALDIIPVPEPMGLGSACAALVLGFAVWRRRRKTPVTG